MQLSMVHHLSNLWCEEHTANNHKVQACQKSKGPTLKMVPGKPTYDNPGSQATACHQFIQAHDPHAQARVLHTEIGKIAQGGRNKDRGSYPREHLQHDQVGKRGDYRSEKK